MQSRNIKFRKIEAVETYSVRQSVLRPGLAISSVFFTGDEDPRSAHFGVLIDGTLVSVGSICPESCEHVFADNDMKGEGIFRLRGMATLIESRSQGFGAKVLQACLQHAKSHGASLIWAHARIGAMTFYLRQGFQKVGELYEIPIAGPHYLIKNKI